MKERDKKEGGEKYAHIFTTICINFIDVLKTVVFALIVRDKFLSMSARVTLKYLS
jgi:hypothetical protein